jgi:uncharacterized protein
VSNRSAVSFVSTLVAFLVLLATGVAQGQQLSINDVTISEGDVGTRVFNFTVSLNTPAGPGGVFFDIATADDTAVAASGDYVAKSLTTQLIPFRSSTYVFTVLVNGDTMAEPGETFFVNVTNVTGATYLDAQGLGTIVDDDSLTLIHDIQGNGVMSPMVGNVVTIRGIVTGVAFNGFFVQEEDAEVDADPATSEAIFVYTFTPPTADVLMTKQVKVAGTVQEFVPSNDPQSPSSTRLVSPTVISLGPVGEPRPIAVPLTATFPDPAGPHDQLERLEHMRVIVSSLTTSAPTGGTFLEADATGAIDGRFYGVVTGVARPFREAGIQAPNMPPSGTIPPIPRFDANPERIRVDSTGLLQAALIVQSGDIVGPLAGPLTYDSRAYSLMVDGTSTASITPGARQTTVSAAAADEVTVASINLNRFFNNVDDPGYIEPVLTPAAFDRRLAKASLAIRDHLHNPDIIGVQEVEHLATLQTLAARIGADGGPTYQAFLVPGTDIYRLSVGFLVKTEEVALGVPRVAVNLVTQVGGSVLFPDPRFNSSAPLYDRPPLLLEAAVNGALGGSFPITVIVTDLMPLTNIGSEAPAGLTTMGNYVRVKRLAQADFLANFLQTRQSNAPTERLAVIGSFNALEVNDGYVDVMNMVTGGTPTPDNETVVPGDGVDVVNPALVRLVEAQPSNRYSQLIDGNAAATDHVLVSGGLVNGTTGRRVERARLAADYSENNRNQNSTALRFSDRDPVVAYFNTDAFFVADVSIINHTASTVIAGESLTYNVTVQNAGPDAATSVAWSDTLPAGTVFESLGAAPGWSCTTPAVGAHGTITCSRTSFAVGGSTFLLTVRVASSVAPHTVLSNTVNVTSSTTDPEATNNSSTALTTVDSNAELSIAVVPTPSTVVDAGQEIRYTVTVTNNGPSDAVNVFIVNPVVPPATFKALYLPGGHGWSLSVPPIDGAGVISMAKPSMASGEVFIFDIRVQIDSATPGGTAYENTAAVAAKGTPDPATGNNTVTTTTLVDGAPSITAIGDQTIAEDASTAALIFGVSDIGAPAADLIVTATSSDQALVPNANIVLGGGDATRSVTVTPVANGHGGPVTITLTVSDGALSSSETFTVTVTPVNDAPTIEPIADQTTSVNVASGPLALTIADIDDDASALSLSATSSNATLVSAADIQFSGNGGSRSVIIAPRPDETGDTTITITVSDGEAEASASFRLTVSPSPSTRLTWFLAEGATGDFFDEDLVIANPNAAEVPVTLTFFQENAPSVTETRTLPARSGVTLRVDTLPGLEAAAASVEVSSDNGLPLAVERTQFWGAGSYGGHTETAVAGPATRWYFAEGAQGFFDTFLLVANPHATPVDVTLTFLREGEVPVTTTVSVAPFSRKTVPASSIPDLASRAFSIVVDAPLPVVAERAMYFGTTATRSWSGGGAAAGASAPSSTWYFAEGATGSFFDTFILLMNPDETEARVTMRYLLDSGETIDVPKIVPARGRLTVSIDSEADPRLQSAAMATVVASDRPIVAERSVYWATAEGAEPWGESHTSQGAAAAAPRWALAEGRSGGALNFHTYVLLANPGAQAAEVTVRFLPESGEAIAKTYTVPALSRVTIDVSSEAPALRDRSFVTVIETNDSTPIVVERSMYWDGSAMTWSGGSNAFATRLP